MKKFTLALMALLSLTFATKAQQYVSTEPANRNVILEEFTGRGCQYCPDGHRIANEIMAANPGRVWAINVHAGSYALTNYPNFNTPESTAILGGFSVSGFPAGVVNRSTAAGQSRSAWNGLTNTQLNQAAECNVAGFARINSDTRVATITVEVYYTGNSTADENYLTVAMLQDSILGSQSGGSTWNPTQMIGGQYVHMHVLRSTVTSTWGDAITPTTAGTLITKTFEYQIPEVIGDPNGAEVKIDNIFFLAWVSERYQGTPTRPILTGCKLAQSVVTEEPIYPKVSNVAQAVKASCDNVKTFNFKLTNIGQNTLNSIKFNANVENINTEFEWTGELVSGDNTNLSFDMELPFGTYNGTLYITEVNGQAYEASWGFNAESAEWGETVVDGDVTNLKVYIIQDQFGEQTTWNIINSNGEIIAEGGPYQHLAGSGGTQVNVANITDVPTDDCYLFRIFDSNNNGICCTYGEGFYYIKDAHNTKIVEGNGDFGSMAAHTFSIIKNPQGVVETASSIFNIYPNPAEHVLNISSDVNSFDYQIINSVGQVVMSGNADGNATINVSELSGVYFLRIIADGETIVRKVTIK